MQPILYSFRRCPYAMRARMAVYYSGVKVELREIVLKNKPPHMLQYSAKGTVPVLLLPSDHVVDDAEKVGDGVKADDSGMKVIDESWDVMVWALSIHDPDHWMPEQETSEYQDLLRLVQQNDNDFKGYLDRYKYADRFPEHSAEHYRGHGERFLVLLEERLQSQPYLLGDSISAADVAIMPFVRQFAHVDLNWFTDAPYPKLRAWLETFLESALFTGVMYKYSPWAEGDAVLEFPKE